MYTAPFRFSKFSPRTFLFLKNAYTVCWMLWLGGIGIFFATMFSNIPPLVEKLTFFPFVIGAGVIGFIFIPIIFVFLGFRKALEMTIEGDKMLFLDRKTKEVVSQNSVQNIKGVSLDGYQIGRGSTNIFVFLIDDSISGLQPFIISSGARVVFFKSLFDFEVELSKNGVVTKDMQKVFAKNKQKGKIFFGLFGLSTVLFLIYRFLL